MSASIRRFALALLILSIISSCAWAPRLQVAANTADTPGQIVDVVPLGGYRHLTLRALFWSQDLSHIPTNTGIRLYRLTYLSRAADGRVVPASGLLALPANPEALRGMVSWQHGTATLKKSAPSTPDAYNGLLAAAIFAGHGYGLFAPDYLGFGVSQEPHSYYNTRTIVDSVVHGLNAARGVLQANGIPWPQDVFLTGFSQGGHASLATLRRTETVDTGLAIRAVASVAGATDLAGIGFSNALQGRDQLAALFISWIAITYARDYDKPLSDVLKPQWVDRLPTLFDGYHDGEAIVAELPQDPKALLTNDLLHSVQNDRTHWFIKALEANGLVGWAPKSPVRLYYGEDDVIVTPAQALSFAAATPQTTTALSVGKADHNTSIVVAAPLLRDWFDELSR